jgi:hypothetical protein
MTSHFFGKLNAAAPGRPVKEVATKEYKTSNAFAFEAQGRGRCGNMGEAPQRLRGTGYNRHQTGVNQDRDHHVCS